MSLDDDPLILEAGWWCEYEGLYCAQDPERDDFAMTGHFGYPCGERDWLGHAQPGHHIRVAIVRLPDE